MIMTSLILSLVTAAGIAEVPVQPAVVAAKEEPAKAAPAAAQTPTEDPKAEFAELKDPSLGLDKRPYAAPQAADPNKRRQLWNIWPVAVYGRFDNMRFGPQSVTTPEGPLHASLGNNVGLGFGASIEALPTKWGAVMVTWDYRYGFSSSSSLSIDGPANYKFGSVDVVASHQVGVGVALGFKAYRSLEWNIGLEQRLEAYKVTGSNGSPSSTRLERPWARAQARWSLDMIRDLRPFIAVDVAVPLRSTSVGNDDYVKDLQNLVGAYPSFPPQAAGDSLAKGHAAKFQIGVTYGVRLFRPRRKWRAPVVGVDVVPVKPVEQKDYAVPVEAITRDQRAVDDDKAHIISFKASATKIHKGGCVELVAVFDGGVSAVIDQGVGKVTSGKSVSICPSGSRIYIISVTGKDGTVAKAAVRVDVE